MGIEPMATRLKVARSTAELTGMDTQADSKLCFYVFEALIHTPFI